MNTPADLERRILDHVVKTERKIFLIRLTAFGTATAGSAIVAIPLFLSLNSALTQSGFYDYASLVTSDTTAVGTYWKDLGMTLVESLPSFALAGFLAACTGALWSSTRTIKTFTNHHSYGN